MDSSDPAGWHFLHMIRFIFYSVRTLICQQSPKLVLTDSDKGFVLTASANLITKSSQCYCNARRSPDVSHMYLITITEQSF